MHLINRIFFNIWIDSKSVICSKASLIKLNVSFIVASFGTTKLFLLRIDGIAPFSCFAFQRIVQIEQQNIVFGTLSRRKWIRLLIRLIEFIKEVNACLRIPGKVCPRNWERLLSQTDWLQQIVELLTP